MLELFTKSILELSDLILRNRNPKAKLRKSARGALRFHWILKWVEIYSSGFIYGLQLLVNEGRLSSALLTSLEGLKDKVDELYEIIRKDQLGHNTGFWEVAGIFDAELQRELQLLIGVKVTRLANWQRLLESAFKEFHDQYFQFKWDDAITLYVPTDSFVGPPDILGLGIPTSLGELLDSGQLRMIQTSDVEEIKKELDKAEELVKRIKLARDRLDEFIRTHYSFEDFL